VAFAFAANGRRLASAGADGSILLWDVSRQPGAPRKEEEPLTAKALDGLWSDLAGEDATTAFRAICTLAQAPEQSLPVLRERTAPPAPIDLKRIPKLIEELDSGRFEVRQKAVRELRRLGTLAVPALNEALAAGPSLEVRRRLESLLKDVDLPQATPEELRTARALEVLERIGTPEARQAVEALSWQGQESWLGQEVQATLIRMRQRASRP
jgi:hypothetical protein